MAAAREPLTQPPEVVDLRRVSGRQLEPLLLEETVEWARELDWDFGRSADLVRQYADSRSMQGLALIDRGEVVGYGYSVLEDHKGLVGDLYLRPFWRTPANQALLMRVMLQTLSGISQVRRIESQVMLLGADACQLLRNEDAVQLHERVLMTLDLTRLVWGGLKLPGSDGPPRFRLELWSDYQHQAVGGIITQAYRGHIDSQINDQYRTHGGAQRFLYNIVQYPGCGSFFRPASCVAFDRASGLPAGVILTSLVGPETGHITQLCVGPLAQGEGLGAALLARSLYNLRESGMKRVTLTVTVANANALRLYRGCGFEELRRFFACVREL